MGQSADASGLPETLAFVRIAEEHLPEVLAIECEAYPDPWSERMFRQEIEQNVSYFYVMLFEGRVAGYVGFWLVVDEAHITSVTVRDCYRRRGFGRRAMEFILERAKRLGVTQVTLEVRASNLRAQALYTGMGFEVLYRRRNYYNNREDALVMARPL
ncbi:MAG TPA: ribosomal protein S18-alanine N-acetyltransferase [Candidatus Hydrogenedentes bacterium]|nr:ribosomal protein S18-alanine N-acetyltransferase [Candidatus Hydrogenedentota bacterium]HPC18073.1 ribosomal protein S18-alanine N-acetyltransferase [Candidatus Hydrogenedentota bacterium]HRT22211.1 ribosomal protein S18-alanine N-acetyltransferase [Candidatus Hydrogenedentota bacterium]HRT66524.1 ribosomal protein S18-alanine N-acetyltransferase [Candidatus Hydrogenedentota bacterium]